VASNLATAASDTEVIQGPWPGSTSGNPNLPGGRVLLRLGTSYGRTVVKDLYQAQPLRLLFPRPAPAEIFQAALVCVSGGLVGGDRLHTDIAIEPDARAMIVGQAAEKVYRSLGPDCLVSNRLEVGARGWLEYLPQETIVFDSARLRRKTAAIVGPEAIFIGGDILVFGRAARNERLTKGLIHDNWEIRDGFGRLLWKDALHLDGDLAQILSAAVTFDGATAYATIIAVGLPRELCLNARVMAGSISSTTLRVFAAVLRGCLVFRFVGRSTLELRKGFGQIWCGLRSLAGDLPPRLPALWSQ